MIAGRIICPSKVRVRIMSEPRVEQLKDGLFESYCQVKLLPLSKQAPQLDFGDEADGLCVFWSLTQKDADKLKVGSIVSGEAFLCHNEDLEEYFILVTRWRLGRNTSVDVESETEGVANEIANP